MSPDEVKMDEFYITWCIAEYKACELYDELDEDFTHPNYIGAEQASRDLLFIFLRHPTKSLRHILLKLEVANDMEDYLTDATNPVCRDIAPHAVIGAIDDLKELTGNENAYFF